MFSEYPTWWPNLGWRCCIRARHLWKDLRAATVGTLFCVMLAAAGTGRRWRTCGATLPWTHRAALALMPPPIVLCEEVRRRGDRELRKLGDPGARLNGRTVPRFDTVLRTPLGEMVDDLQE